MLTNRIVEYVFFFGLLAFVGYLVWQIIAPFMAALALAAIIVTITYPLYERIIKRMPWQNATLAAGLTTFLVVVVIILPVFFLTSALVGEAVAIYKIVGNDQQLGFITIVQDLEQSIQVYAPAFELNATEYLRQGADWLTGNLNAIFTGTVSTIFLFFIALIASFYFFRDGRDFTKVLVRISPLPDKEDELILRRLATAVRSVATGTVLVALIQGTLTAIGLGIFGFERAILWGSIAALGALIPSVGTSIVFVPSVLYLILTGDYFGAAGLAAWGIVAVGLIDNLLGPYLMSRGSPQHPFIILLAVLGGISLFGPIGFIVGPVVISFFTVMLELYSTHIADNIEANHVK